MDAASRFRHDLRNGLHNIKLALSVAQIETDPAEAAQWLHEIIVGADECVKIIDRFEESAPAEPSASAG